MKRRYTIKRLAAEDFNKVQVYCVGNANVWVSPDRMNCTQCFGPLQAMLAVCPHTRALRRYLKAGSSLTPEQEA